MLAGLIFATEESQDRAGVLAATLPFGGMTLIEYQARLLVSAGVGHLLIAVGRVTPALLGAVHRIERRGIAVDIVRSAEEAAAKVHPLASVVAIADGLVTTEPVTRAMAAAVPDTLLVTAGDGPEAVERIDSETCWAGIAILSAKRLAELAAMPREYDFQSTLLRLAVQNGARRTSLSAGAAKAGHGVERNSAALSSRSNAVLAALATRRTGWADRFVFTPITRVLLPVLVGKAAPPMAVFAGGGGFALGSIAAILLGHPAIGVFLALASVTLLSSGSLLSWLRGDDRHARWQEGAIAGTGAATVLVLGAMESREAGTASAAILALVLVAAAALSERAPSKPRPWWGAPTAYLLLLTPFILAGHVTLGLGAGAVYAGVTLAAAVEACRQKA